MKEKEIRKINFNVSEEVWQQVLKTAIGKSVSGRAKQLLLEYLKTQE